MKKIAVSFFFPFTTSPVILTGVCCFTFSVGVMWPECELHLTGIALARRALQKKMEKGG